MTLCVTVQVQSFKGYYPCISSQLAEKFSLLHYNQDVIDLFNLFGIHMYIVFTSRLYVWLFKFNHLKHITPAYHHNLVRSLHCYVTTRTSLTFSIYLWDNLMDITPAQYHNLARSLYYYVAQRQHHRPFQFMWDPYLYRL